MNKGKVMTGRDFKALPDAEKERIFRELDKLTPEQVKAALRLPRPRSGGTSSRRRR